MSKVKSKWHWTRRKKVLSFTSKLMSYTLCRPSWKCYRSHVWIVNEINKMIYISYGKTCLDIWPWMPSNVFIHLIEHPIRRKYPIVYVLLSVIPIEPFIVHINLLNRNLEKWRKEKIWLILPHGSWDHSFTLHLYSVLVS